ncbi:MAG TPA: beta-propeller fold lactonase family protein [Burkholderiales bacterium]
MTGLYSAVGEQLTHYVVDVGNYALHRQSTVMLPAPVQYVWPHPSKQFLYVVSGHRGKSGPGSKHCLSALRVDETGALHEHGPVQSLPQRPLHVSLDATGSYALVAYNDPAGITVHRINADRTIGPQVEQPAALDVGIFPHQTLMMPGDRSAILVTRGNDAAAHKAEDPGALKVMRFEDGVLRNVASIAPGGGYGFGPRHLDFHPTQPWVYVSLERQNKLQMYERDGDQLAATPKFEKDLLAEPSHVRPRQLGGTVHVHPGGRYVYVANRADDTTDFEGTPVFAGGENSIAAYAIDPGSGEPELIQHADPQSFHVRTFAIEPTGRMLVTASIMPMHVRDDSGVHLVPAALTIFRIGEDGRLAYMRKYDVATNGKHQFWMGIVG